MTMRPPHFIHPVRSGGRPTTGENYVPAKLWGEGEWTLENNDARLALERNNPVKAATALWARAVAALTGELPHAIRFKGMWVVVHDRVAEVVEFAHEAAFKAVLAFEIQQAAADSNRPWRRIPLAIVNNDDKYLGTYDLKTATEAREFLDAWTERENREHAMIHDMLRFVVAIIEGAYTLTAEANAARTAGNTALETAKVEAWQASIAQCNAITAEVTLARLYDDPNLLVSVVPTDGQALAADGAVTIHASRKRWTIPVRASGTGRIRFRNVVKDYVGLADAKWRMGSTTDTATGKSIILNLDEDVPVGTYTVWIDLLATGNPDPVAETSVEITVPGTSVTANAGRGVSVPSGQAVQIGGSDTVKYPVGDTTVAWTRTSGEGGTLIDADHAKPTFAAPTVTENREIVWRKTVTNNGVSDLDEVSVTVTP